MSKKALLIVLSLIAALFLVVSSGGDLGAFEVKSQIMLYVIIFSMGFIPTALGVALEKFL